MKLREHPSFIAMNTPLRLLLLTCLILTSAAFADDPPLLARGDAKQTLEHMGWREVNILAIRQGVDEKGAHVPISAIIVAYGTRNGKSQQFSQCLTYDRELGWHLLELGEKASRMWNKDGYFEIKPWGTWSRVTTN